METQILHGNTNTAWIVLFLLEQNIYFITLKLLQILVTLHTYTTIYKFGDKTGHTNNG